MALAGIISYCIGGDHKEIDFRSLDNLFLLNCHGLGRPGETVYDREGFIASVGTKFRPSLVDALDSAYVHISEACEGKGTLCVIKKKRKGKVIFHLFVFPMYLDNAHDTPIPILPANSKTLAGVEPLPIFTVMIEDEFLRLSKMYHSESNTSILDKAVMNIFLDNFTVGRKAWQYWQVWSRAYSVTVEL